MRERERERNARIGGLNGSLGYTYVLYIVEAHRLLELHVVYSSRTPAACAGVAFIIV